MEFIESKKNYDLCKNYLVFSVFGCNNNTPITSYDTKLMPEMTTFSKVSDYIKDLTYDYIDTELIYNFTIR
ncbi:hypothetical protein [Pseudobacteroides cellulosolvens]|uniref:Uncharacterized protein n=1 Tax=Pseudobacteroides cellulosolvens ATCC 35603 = DSM 2933 TaxID=398512 RepID=A0A0L6JR89_9FIRM|nr:hypothetical protein [Pseudobacteroides cellulosolvens]KNY28293.1 hypothetical protein Bccel_3567 [Pseudobacteroides cellulosolvens ATCC 35603 = DSM 2933]